MKNLFYAQSGGVTAVINASACGVIEEARKHKNFIGNVLAGKNGIIGAVEEELIDTSALSDAEVAKLRHTPGGAFGSCRFKLPDSKADMAIYKRLSEVFQAHNIGYFVYNGGGDSSDTSNKISAIMKQLGVPLVAIGVPKTIDNDLPITDCCPGFGSVAKYVATSIREAALDVHSMSKSSTKVFILEVMGRHAGWIAAACALAGVDGDESTAPHLVLLPEIEFDEDKFLAAVKNCVDKYGYCVVAASEGIKGKDGKFIAESGAKDSFGHAQLGGVAPRLAGIVADKLKLKYHWAVSDYLQRSARHLASKTDVEQAYQVGRHAVQMAVAGKNGQMPIIKRLSDAPYQWEIAEVNLSDVANIEKKIPSEFISANGMGITTSCRKYLLPLIQGEDYPPYINGLPDYLEIKPKFVGKKLPSFADK